MIWIDIARIIIPGLIFGGILGKFLSDRPEYFKLLRPKRWIKKGKKAEKNKWLFIIFVSFIIGISSRYIIRQIYILIKNIWEVPIAPDNLFTMIPLPILLVSITLIPILEEWIFRGVILEEISKIGNSKILGLISSSLLFAAFHLSNPGTNLSAVVPYFAAGLMLGGSYLIGGLAVATLSHIIYNLYPYLLYLITLLR